MKLIYSGKTKDFTPELEEKVTGKLVKLSKMIEQRGEREAHLIHQVERHLHKVEIIVNFYDHSLIGEGTDADLGTSLSQAVEKLEKQVVKLRTRARDTQRDPKAVREGKESWEDGVPAPAVVANGNGKPALAKKAQKPRIYMVDYDNGRKPMTLEEALIEMEGEDSGYVVFRDSEHSCLSVLIKRADGHFDLVRS